MSDEKYRVKELARLAGVTVRTLHYYHEIGLLPPSSRTDAGYRLYDADDLLRLQQILIGRELGLSLEQIRESLDDPSFDHRAALLRQREQLERRVRDARAMLRAVDEALSALKGENDMDPKTLFDGFDPSDHDEEVRERWGDSSAYAESSRRTKTYTKDDWTRIKGEAESIMVRMAEHLRAGAAADSEGPTTVAEEHRLHIDRWFYPCSPSMHAGLAEMYVADDRFAASFEKHANGLAPFFAAAIRANSAGSTE